MPEARQVIDQSTVIEFGRSLARTFEDFRLNRRIKEEQWLKNLRQYRGIYDPGAEAKMRKDGSRVYPRITRVKTIGTTARIMEMMFPQSDKNYAVDPTSRPNLSQPDLQQVLNILTAEWQARQQAAAENGGTQPGAAALAIPDEEIEKAIKAFAVARAGNMGLEIEDELQEMNYVDLARRVVFSGTLYGLGVAKGPNVDSEKVRTWQQNPQTGVYEAVEEDQGKPVYTFTPVWNYYPDLSATSFDEMDGEFERNPISKHSLIALKKRPDYIPEQVREVLRRYPEGNYVEHEWEQSMRSQKSDQKNINKTTRNKWEHLEFWGLVAGSDLAAAGEQVPEEQMEELFAAHIVFIGDIVVKAVLLPFARQKSIFHKFVYRDDDGTLLGVGLPEDIRESQMAICNAARMLLDNCDAVCGPIVEMDIDLLLENQTLDIHGFKTYLKEGGKGFPTNAGNQAVRDITVNAHITELLSVIRLFLEFVDTETMQPPPALGAMAGPGGRPQGSEAYRTQGGASMLLGAAALPVRDTVRNFDRFTGSFISSLYDWLMQFRDKPEIKGDFKIRPTGSDSLIAKEVRATQLDQLSATLSQDERDHIKERRLVEERLKVRDLARELLEDEDVVKQKRDARAKAQESAQQIQEDMVRAQIREVLASAANKLAQAQKNQTAASSNVLQSLIELIDDGTATGGEGQPAGANPDRVVPAAERAGSEAGLGAAPAA